ncbi:MAG TPA: hypothetical protein H9705_09565 [Candidatus Fusicatenibacter intestinigallinarum]|uniref:DUF1492 domain-containing protein n=1 Tax=Candidatus Fusicatenibacter intestinigallinarum TaxID=2838598 RepID=A0A9D2SMY1_9FIRM|nr:hypothetical protein [Candidatus Fusicatenibacter intestinigallinarum]
MDKKTENEKKKEYLKSYRDAVVAETQIKEEIDQLRLDKMFPSLVQDGMPHGSGSSDLSAYAAKLDELLSELEEQMNERIQLRREIVRKIECMESETEKAVLRYRYIHMLKWEEIAVKMHYGYRNILKVHGRALEHFEQ